MLGHLVLITKSLQIALVKKPLKETVAADVTIYKIDSPNHCRNFPEQFGGYRARPCATLGCTVAGSVQAF